MNFESPANSGTIRMKEKQGFWMPHSGSLFLLRFFAFAKRRTTIPTTKWFCHAVLRAGTSNLFRSGIFS